jgi:WD40 repeat protein
VSASADRTVRVWSLPDGRERASFSGAFDVLSARLSPDGTRVVTASSDRFLRVWTIEGAALEREFAPPQLNLFDTFPISAAFFSTDGGRVFGRYGPIVDRRDGVSRALSGVEAVSPDGRLALDAQLQVVDVDTGIPIVRLPHSGKGVRQAAFSEDGGSILALLQDGTVQTWAAPIVADGRTLHARLCRDALAAGLRLSAEDRADPLVRMVIGPADERPCERRGLFAALAR